MIDPGTRAAREVVNRSTSLDGVIAGPGGAVDRVFDFAAPNEFPWFAAANGARFVGRRTYDVSRRVAARSHRNPP